TSMIVEEIAGPGGATTLRSATVSYGFGLNGLGQDLYFSCGARRDTSNNASDVLLAEQIDDGYAGGLVAPNSWTDPLLGVPVSVAARADRTQQGGAALRCSGPDGTLTREPAFATITGPTG